MRASKGGCAFRNIQNIEPETSTGLENFRRVCHTPNASEALDPAFSVGAATPGQSQGTGHMFWGKNVRFSSTFKYWKNVLTAALNLIPRLIGTISTLLERLYTSEAREAAAEARAAAQATAFESQEVTLKQQATHADERAAASEAREVNLKQQAAHANERAAALEAREANLKQQAAHVCKLLEQQAECHAEIQVQFANAR